MRKIIANSFELDISNKQLTEIDENNWFTDDLRLRITFPFSIVVDDKINEYFQNIIDHNSETETVIPIFYNHYDVLEHGELELLEINDRTLDCQISYGDEELSTWNRKLSELSLTNITVNDIYAHAVNIITQAWPQTTYNFPQIHVDKFDITTDEMFAFEERLNLYRNGAFVENFVDEEDITYNKNIMQPLPYWLHILERGCADAGFQLAGDILDDVMLQKTLVYADVEYYLRNFQEAISDTIMSDDHFETGLTPQPPSFTQETFAEYQKSYNILPGKYRIIGTVYLKYHFINNIVVIKLNGITIFNHNALNVVNNFDLPLNIVFETSPGVNPNIIEIYVLNRYEPNQITAEININPIRIHDDSGNAIPNIINENKVNLARAVPDISFGEFMKITKNWFNYDWTPIDGVLYVNKIETQVMQPPVHDISKYMVKSPNIKFNKLLNFILGFQDVQHDEYKWLKLFINRNGVQTFENIPETLIDENTNQIEINALPLPNLFRRSVDTAHAFLQDNTRIFAVIYDGLVNSLNVTRSSQPLQMLNIYENYWKFWLQFRINAKTYKWRFYDFIENTNSIKSKDKLFAYNKHFISRRLTKKEIAPDFIEVEIEADTLE